MKQGFQHLTECFAEETASFRLRMINGVVQESNLSGSSQFGIRSVSGGEVSYLCCEGLETAAGLAADTRGLVDALPAGAGARELQGALAPLDLAQFAAKVDQAVRRVSQKIWRVEVFTRQFEQQVRVANSEGLATADRRGFTGLRVTVTTKDGNRVRSAVRTTVITNPRSLLGSDSFLFLAEEAAAEAERRLHAVAVKGGEMAVVLGPGNPAILFHEACGHGLEADLAAQPGAAFGGKIGCAIASEQVSLLDDPTYPGLPGTQSRDDEGTPTGPTLLIDRGRLVTYMHDRVSARSFGREANGHGRRLSAAFPPMPRMSNTYVAPGEYQPDEIIASTPHGIFVTRIGAGDTNMMTGDFNLECAEGYLIEAGRLTAPITGAVLAGNGREVLRQIDRVGCDLAMSSPVEAGCTKIDQGPLPIAQGQPTVRVAKLRVWGG